jgi:hypothetical protein
MLGVPRRGIDLPTLEADVSHTIGTTEVPRPPAKPHNHALSHARVLVELGSLSRAEAGVAEVLDRDPDDLDALGLFAKIKHIRGELSMAVACEAQLHARRPAAGELTRMHLESILHLAQDPERGAGEFLAAGQFRLVQKPTSYLALEEAFRLYLARKPNDARAVCQRVGHQYRERDREVYRLAVMAEAWICELIGDLPSASEILERLGEERGFETDIDRLIALVGLYERLGSRDKLESAVNICRHLLQHQEERSVLGRLASLHRRLGHEDLAMEYEALHLAAYRHAMHRPSFAETIAVAMEHYVPVERLRRISFPDVTLDPETPARGRAIARALEGRLAEARSLLAGGTELLDLKYRADFEALEAPESERAVQLHVQALRADPGDIDVLGWLLASETRSHSPAIADLMRDPEIAPQALAGLDAATRAEPGEPVHWRRLATFFGVQRRGETQARQFMERAQAVERAARDRSRAIGRVLSPAVYRLMGRSVGLVHEIWVGRERSAPASGGTLRREDILGSLTDQMKDDVRNTFLAVREYARSRFPHSTRDILDFNYTFKVTKEDEPSGGTSAGLPTAMAFLSMFLQRPVPQDTAFTGVVVTDAHDVINVRPVGDLEHKVDAAYHRNLRMILVPAGNQMQLEQSGTAPREILQEIVRYVSTLEDATRLVFGVDAFV